MGCQVTQIHILLQYVILVSSEFISFPLDSLVTIYWIPLTHEVFVPSTVTASFDEYKSHHTFNLFSRISMSC